MSQEIFDLRARDAKAKAAFCASETDRHPHGLSGKIWIIPREFCCDCRDTQAGAWEFSEWGNGAGSV